MTFWRTYCLKCGRHLKGHEWKNNEAECKKCRIRHMRYWENDGIIMQRKYKVVDEDRSFIE